MDTRFEQRYLSIVWFLSVQQLNFICVFLLGLFLGSSLYFGSECLSLGSLSWAFPLFRLGGLSVTLRYGREATVFSRVDFVNLDMDVRNGLGWFWWLK
jgi:hypothetical protein